jgi:FkbM family methyltransferase
VSDARLREHAPSAASRLAARAIVGFYELWHGRLRLKGAGYLVRVASQYVRGMQRYSLMVPSLGVITVDLRDYAGRLWLQRLLGDPLASFDSEDSLGQAIANALSDGAVVWDVGASVGFVTAALVSDPRVRQIVSFEPNPFLSDSLRSLFARHDKVIVLPVALSDTAGEAVLHIPRGKSVGGTIVEQEQLLATAGIQAADVIQRTVEQVSGDDLLARRADLLPPDIVKIDVEGHERAVIGGLRKTLEVHRPTVIFEHLYLSDDEVRALVPPGYTLRTLRGEEATLTDGFERAAGHNSVLLPPAAAGRAWVARR